MIQSCSVCGASALVYCCEYGPIPLCDAYSSHKEQALAVALFSVDVVRCNQCQHAELAEKPPEEQIYAEYNYFSSNSPDLGQHFRHYALWLKEYLALKTNAVHLDVGCNDGLLLEQTAAQGFETLGVDPSPAAVKAQEKGLRVYKGYLSDELIRQHGLSGVADVITCNNVMANIRDLRAFGDCIVNMLQNGGYFVVETLHFPTLLHNRVFEMVNHEHYHYFSVASIQAFFDRIGLDLISCEHVATKGANMRCVGRKRLAGSAASEAQIPDIDPVLARHEACPDFEGFHAELSQARVAIRSAIQEARRRGPIAGFGSSAGTTILMYLLGVQNDIDFLVDDNPSRHGFYAPGSGIPVLSPADYHSKKPAMTIIFAWRFAAQIIEKHRASLASEHRFVLANSGADS